jgi:hypothetical protein
MLKRPAASVVAVAICDGLVAVIVAPATGAPVDVATTVPPMEPVVPALAGNVWKSSAAIAAVTVIQRPAKRYIDVSQNGNVRARVRCASVRF